MLLTNSAVSHAPIATPEIGSIYTHYKGKQYKVIGIGHHTETMEPCVVYQALYDSPEFGNQAIWIRPLEMFMGNLIVDGKEIQRFVRVENREF